MGRSLVVMLALAALGYAGICALLFFTQRTLIYFPQRERALAAPLLVLEQGPVRVNVSVRANAGPNALLYFGGNADDVSTSLPLLAEAFPEHALFLMHYRGYGGSSGSPTEAALHADALALFDQVKDAHPRIWVIGRSLGSGVAVKLASERALTQLVLVTPYASIADLAAKQFPIFPVRLLLKDKFESWRYAPTLTVPTHLIVAEHDGIIPEASSKKLLAHFRPGVAHYTTIASADHNSISAIPSYAQALATVVKTQ